MANVVYSRFCPLFNTQKMSIKSIKQQGTLSPVAKTNQRILKIYEQVCAITGTVMCPSVEKALQNGISEELYLETVSAMETNCLFTIMAGSNHIKLLNCSYDYFLFQ